MPAEGDQRAHRHAEIADLLCAAEIGKVDHETGRDDIGAIAPGMAADLALFRVDTLAMAGGAVHDPIAALMFCASPRAEYTIVNGRVVVREGQLATLDLPVHVERHNRMAMQLVTSL